MVDSGVNVAIRIRPLINETTKPIWRARDDRIISSTTDPSCSFGYDHVFDERWSTQDIYNKIGSPVVKSFVEGFNATIFAYGQTASGKSYTIMGDPEKDCLGIIPYSLIETFELFQQNPHREFLLNVSFMEIYNEKITDLLNVNNNLMRIRETKDGSVTVANLTEVTCVTVDDVVNVLAIGTENRTVGETNFNLRSSRAHTIFTIMLESRDTTTDNAPAKISSMNLVDLAGSEKPSLASNESHRFKEGAFINSSLLSLGRVISGLAEGRSHVPYRESKLTRILQPSLGGNSKTLIICTVSPTSHEETVSTLRFASCASKVKNKPIINEVMTVEQKLREKVQALIEQNQLLTGQLKGNLDTEERKELLAKIDLLGTAKTDAEKKAEMLELELKKHVIGHSQQPPMDHRRRTYLVPPVSTPSKMAAEEVFHMSPMFKRSDTITKAKRRQTMLACRSKTITFVAKAPDEDELSDYDTTPVKALDFNIDQPNDTRPTSTATVSTQTEPCSRIETESQTEPCSKIETESQTDLCSKTEAHTQTLTLKIVEAHTQTDSKSETHSKPHSNAHIQTETTSRPVVVHRPDKCVFTDLNQSYLCIHRTEASATHRELDNALYVNDEQLILIDELNETLKVKDEEIVKLTNQIKAWEESNQAQEEILCSLQTKLTQTNRKCQSLQEEIISLQKPSMSLSQELELEELKSKSISQELQLEELKSKNTELRESLKSSEDERFTVKAELGTVKDQLKELKAVLTKQIPDSEIISRQKKEISNLKTKLQELEETVNELQIDCEDYQKSIKQCNENGELDAAKINELEEENVSLKTKLEKLQEELKNSEIDYADAQDLIKQCNKNGEDDAARINELKEENFSLKSKVNKIQEELKNSQIDYDDAQDLIRQCNKNGEDDAAKINELEEENFSLKNKIDKIHEELKNSQIDYDDAQDLIRKFSENAELDIARIEELEEEILSLKTSSKKLQEELEKSYTRIQEAEYKCNKYTEVIQELNKSNTSSTDSLEKENLVLKGHIKNLENKFHEEVKAEYMKYQELEIKNKDLQARIMKHHQLEKENEEQQAKINELQGKVDELKFDNDDLAGMIERCNKAGEEDAEAIQELQDKNHDLEMKIQALQKVQVSLSSSDENDLQKQIRMLNLKLEEAYRISGRGDLMKENLELKEQVGELSGTLKHTQKQEAYYRGIYEEHNTMLLEIKGYKTESKCLKTELERLKKEKQTIELLKAKSERYKIELLRYRAERNELREKLNQPSSDTKADKEPRTLNEKSQTQSSNPNTVEKENIAQTETKSEIPKPKPDTKLSEPDSKATPLSAAQDPPVDTRHLTAHLPFEMPPNVSEEHLFAWGLHPSQKDQFPDPQKPRMSKEQPHLLGFDWEQSLLSDPDSIGKLPFTVTPEKPRSHPRDCQQQ